MRINGSTFAWSVDFVALCISPVRRVIVTSVCMGRTMDEGIELMAFLPDGSSLAPVA